MYEASSPSSEGRENVLKDCFISLLPNMPTGQDNHFSKKRFPKILSCCRENLLKTITITPLNLQVVPNPNAERALKEQVLPILSRMSWAKNTVKDISNIPVTSSDHVPSIQAVTDH
jgi:hypothetical protein